MKPTPDIASIRAAIAAGTYETPAKVDTAAAKLADELEREAEQYAREHELSEILHCSRCGLPAPDPDCHDCPADHLDGKPDPEEEEPERWDFQS